METVNIHGVVFEQNSSGKWKCPLCGEYTLDRPNFYDWCDNCGCPNSVPYMLGIFTEGMKMTFEQAKEAWRNGKQIE